MGSNWTSDTLDDAIVRTVHEIQRRISMQTVELTNYIYKQHGKY
jgi:hypothetical protein